MFSKQSLFKGSPVALLFAVTLKMLDLEKLWLILAEMLDCATLIAAVFVADTVVFHAVPRTRDFWKHMKKVDIHVCLNVLGLPNLSRYERNINSSYFKDLDKPS